MSHRNTNIECVAEIQESVLLCVYDIMSVCEWLHAQLMNGNDYIH